MALIKYDDYYPNYREVLGNQDIKGLDVYADIDEKVGHVDSALVDEQKGVFRYLIIDTGFWVLDKKVLLPIGLADINFNHNRVDIKRLSKQQIENLPEFDDKLRIDQHYEEQVREIYRPIVANQSFNPEIYPNQSYTYDLEPYFYELAINAPFREYEERLMSARFAKK